MIGKKTYNFSQNLKVALLEDLLNAVKDSELFMYLELKPSKVVYANKTRSVDSGREVAKLITKLGLEKKVFIVSFDFLKSLSAKLENPNLVVGSFYEEQYWQQDSVWYSSLKRQLKESFPGLGTCLDGLPNDRSLMDFVFKKGSIFKSMNASFVDMQFTVYNNKKFSNNTFKTLRDNYNEKISFGAWTVYSMKLNSAETDATEKQVQLLIDNGAERLITDDVPKLRKKLSKSSANAQTESLLLVFSLLAIALCAFNLVL
ncbi:uncharacterized protein LOC135686407 [Rhopilema esculentum]|uniref:uncharacterized protein LOC135686407 n=1 Tax=Rhopilema esculentum TaxID=499914 RepID=UPI0031D254AC|eukprot:gene920-10676_t